MNKKQKRVWWILLGLVVLTAMALPKLVASRNARRSETIATNDAGRDPRLLVRFEVVRASKLGDRVLTVGTLLANEEVEIRSEIAGKVEKIYFQEGGRLRQGDLLLKINDAELQAQLTRARHRQSIAEQEAERTRQLFEKNLASREQYDTARNQAGIAQAEVQLIQAQLSKTEIRAPFSGAIGLRLVSEGSYLTPATLISRLQDDRVIKIDFAIPEKYATLVRKGDKISFSVEGLSQKFEGTIYASEARIDPATRTLHVRALSPNPDRLLLPGAFANVELILREQERLMVPASALIPELKGHRVFLYRNGRAISQNVTIGHRNEEAVEVVQGLQPGDTLITSALLQLRTGMAVRPTEGQ